MKIKFVKKIRGFILVEFIVYLLIAVALVTFAVNYIVIISFSKAKIDGAYVAGQDAKIIFSKIEKSIKSASAVNVPTSGASGASLSLAMSDVSKNPTIFQLSGDALTMKEGAGAAQVLHSPQIKAQNIKFYNFSGSVQVQLTLAYVRLLGDSNYQVVSNWQNTYSLRP